MNIKAIQHRAAVVMTAAFLISIPLQAQAAFDYRTIPLLGSLISFIFPAPKVMAAPAQASLYRPAVPNQNTTTVWSIPQPTAGYTYVNGQAQRVYNVYTPQAQARPYAVPQNYPVLQQTNPQAAQQVQTQLAVAPPPAWQYQVSPVAYQQTVPNAPVLSGLNMATAPPTNNTTVTNIITTTSSAPTQGPIAPTSVPTSLSDNRVVDTNASGTYKWPVGTNKNGTSGYVSSVFGERDRDNFVKGCSDGTAAKKDCVVSVHNAIDLAVPVGTNIESVTSGKVMYVDPYCSNPAAKLSANKNPMGTVPAGGCSVAVMNSNGEMMSYLHMSDPGTLKAGDTINAGDSIGKSGNSGASEGAHLHFSVCKISDAKLAAAEKAKANLTRCEAIGGTSVNPLDKLDSKDPRYSPARAKEKYNKSYLACKKFAGKDFEELQKCKTTFQKNFNNKTVAVKAKPTAPLTGALNMGRM